MGYTRVQQTNHFQTRLNQSSHTEIEPEWKQNLSDGPEASELSVIIDGNPSIHFIEEEEEHQLAISTARLSHEIALSAASTSSAEFEAREKEFRSKVLNGFLLVGCFGFVTYTILSVDQGMTRGWNMPEKAMRIPLDNWASYESSLNSQPIATKTAINVIIYLLGDWLSQTVFVKKNVLEFDAVRTMRNGLIGLVFGPIVHQYYEFSDYILPVEVGINRLYKIMMDQTIYLSVKCSIYIVAVNLLAGENWEYSVGMARDKIKGVMFTAWKFWPLVHCITYGAIPARHRILWVNCVDLFWNAILALKTSSAGDDEDGDQGEQVLVSSSDGNATSFAPNGINGDQLVNNINNIDAIADIISQAREEETLHTNQQFEKEEEASLHN